MSFCFICLFFFRSTIGEVLFSFCHWNLLSISRRFHIRFSVGNKSLERKRGKRKYSVRCGFVRQWNPFSMWGGMAWITRSGIGQIGMNIRYVKVKPCHNQNYLFLDHPFFLLFRRVTIIVVWAIAHGLVGYVVAPAHVLHQVNISWRFKAKENEWNESRFF